MPEQLFTATDAIGFSYGVSWNTVRRSIFNWKHDELGKLEAKVESSLGMRDKRLLEEFLEMGAGYVLDFADRTFGEFCEEAVDVDIHSDKYLTHGTSKAKKLRAFWEIESDYLVGRLLNALIDHAEEAAREFTVDDRKLAGQIRRMQDSV